MIGTIFSFIFLAFSLCGVQCDSEEEARQTLIDRDIVTEEIGAG